MMLYKVVVTLASLVFGLFIIAAAVYWQLTYGERSGREFSSDASAAPAQSTFTPEELAEHDGKDGNDCFVAVDGNVYLIEGFALWQMGEHLPSNGRAKCGYDLTDVIDESPHGRSKLQLLQKIGTLAS
jgi:predicted heme/steroid binding protein